MVLIKSIDIRFGIGRDLTRTDPLTSFAGSAFGGTSFWGYFDGDLAEIIIFSRALTDEERKAIEQYLSKKYKITISQ